MKNIEHLLRVEAVFVCSTTSKEAKKGENKW